MAEAVVPGPVEAEGPALVEAEGPALPAALALVLCTSSLQASS